MLKSRNLFYPKLKPQAELNLICFPYAGGGTQIYMPWADELPENVQLIILQPPGRGSDFNSAPIDDLDTLVIELIKIIQGDLNKPYVLFGHSLGSRVAFELMLQASKLQLRLPTHFIASGSRAPDCDRSEDPIHDLPEDEFIEKLKDLNGTPKAVLENEELLSIYSPILRADFKMSESYLPITGVKFPVPLTVLGGDDDSGVEEEDLGKWCKFFSKATNIEVIPGDHFFIDSNREKVLEVVNRVLKASLEASSSGLFR